MLLGDASAWDVDASAVGTTSDAVTLADAATTGDSARSVISSLDSGSLPASGWDEQEFAAITVGEKPSLTLTGSGDLWPSCWSDDGELYAAWGDGNGFDSDAGTDIGVARISGSPVDRSLSGENLAVGDAIGQLWTASGYSRKPTGMACVDGNLYLAVQDLARDTNDAPAATIAVSRDKGRTWEWDKSRPMFSDHEMTTIFFLDKGRDGSPEADDQFVYAYAIDANWRFSPRVESPTHLWLARIPRDALQERARWEWYAGAGEQGVPAWSSDASRRAAVLIDERRVYQTLTPSVGESRSNMTVVAQGGVVYNAPLQRYIYASWTEFTFEFYEAPQPWGPFKRFYEKDFGDYPWTPDKSGGYATTVPSKFISDDGLKMFVQSNAFIGGGSSYSFSLREMSVVPANYSVAVESYSAVHPLADVTLGTSFQTGHPEVLSDRVQDGPSENSWTGQVKDFDFWGYGWSRPYAFSQVSYTSGEKSRCDGFAGLFVDVRQAGEWHELEHVVVEPAYSPTDAGYLTYVLRFPTVSGDGVRVRGRPVGAEACTSIAELEVATTPL